MENLCCLHFVHMAKVTKPGLLTLTKKHNMSNKNYLSILDQFLLVQLCNVL